MTKRTENRLREFRLISRRSQEEISVEVGVPQPTLSRWERSTLCPSPEQRARLAEVLGVTQEFLFPTDEEAED